MSKKSNNSTSNYEIIKATAFWGIIISGIAGIISFIIRCIVKWANVTASILGSIVGVMNLIATIALFVSVFLAAYAHSRGKNKTLKILFWVFAILSILAILGFNVLGMF